MFDRIFSHGSLHAAAHLGFFSGIGMLLPMMSTAWSLHVKPWINSPYGFYIAIGLILLSLMIISFLAGSASKVFRSVGWLVLVPGTLAIILTAFGETNVYSWVDSHVTGFAAAQPAVEFFVEHSVPKTSVLAGLYILIGVGCLWIGRNIQRVARIL